MSELDHPRILVWNIFLADGGWLDKIVHFAHYDVYSLSESKNVRKKPSPFCRWSNSGFFDLSQKKYGVIFLYAKKSELGRLEKGLGL